MWFKTKKQKELEATEAARVEQEHLYKLILNRVKEYFEGEPYVQDALWSWSKGNRIDLVFPELVFKNKKTGATTLFGLAFQIVNPENLKETEDYRNIFLEGNIPCLLLPLNNIPLHADFVAKIENVFHNEFKLLSIN